MAWNVLGVLHTAVFVSELGDSKSATVRSIVSWLAYIPTPWPWQASASLVALIIVQLVAQFGVGSVLW